MRIMGGELHGQIKNNAQGYKEMDYLGQSILVPEDCTSLWDLRWNYLENLHTSQEKDSYE
jgi:hypothetical protein